MERSIFSCGSIQLSEGQYSVLGCRGKRERVQMQWKRDVIVQEARSESQLSLSPLAHFALYSATASSLLPLYSEL
ncbi:hypothetical protein VNO77_18994 [Canavalia gladiata]|uniref:Uncharacterized protein n=1 Tax=Canavalia gladiata TaxID=3824 RepID=A0AAN9QK46_CANGL